MLRRLAALFMISAATTLSGCGYNEFQRLDEQVKAGWSEVVNQYQRRADLIPNIVATGQGRSNFEQETLTKVIKARAKATASRPRRSWSTTPRRSRNSRPRRANCRGALSRLLVVDRAVPQPEGQPGLPGPARAARRHREPHHRGAQPLHQGGAGLQRADAQLPEQPDGDDVRLRGQAELHGRERGGDLGAADGELRQARRAGRLRSRPAAGELGRDARCGRCLLLALLLCLALRSARRRTCCRCRRSSARVIDQTGTLQRRTARRARSQAGGLRGRRPGRRSWC